MVYGFINFISCTMINRFDDFLSLKKLLLLPLLIYQTMTLTNGSKLWARSKNINDDKNDQKTRTQILVRNGFIQFKAVPVSAQIVGVHAKVVQ